MPDDRPAPSLARAAVRQSDHQPSGDRLEGRRRPRRWVTLLLGVAVGLVAAFAMLRAIPYDAATPIVQIVSLTPWIGAVAGVVLTLCVVARRWRLTAVAGLAVAAFGVWIGPFFVPTPMPVGAAAQGEHGAPTLMGQPTTLRVMCVNALYGRADADEIVRMVSTEKVDVLAVVELTTDLRDRLRGAGLDELLPYQVDAQVGTGAEGSGLWATGPLTQVDTSAWSTFAMPSAVVSADGVPVRVTAVHPVPPMPGNVETWHEELTRLGERADADPLPQIMAGDFNASYDHVTFRRMLGDRFLDATRTAGRGLNLSWSPQGVGTPLVDLDHVVTERTAAVGRVVSYDVPGSDHRALVATVRVAP